MSTKSLEERYGGEVLSDNSDVENCKQCKDCLYQIGLTDFSNNYQKTSCAVYEYPDMKPLGVMENRERCEYYEKDE